MKQNPDFLLRDVADTLVLVPVGSAATTFTGMITLNKTSAFLWELLATHQTRETLTQALTDRYDVDHTQAAKDVRTFVETLESAGAIRA